MLLNEKITEVKHTQLTPDGDSFRMKVPVLQSGVKNMNSRTYPLAVVKAAVEELRAKLKKRTAFGSTKHEKDLEVDAVSHYIEDIELDEKGMATAVLKILPTTKGKNLSAIIRGGGSLGVSARGFGDVDESGNVKPGYRLAGVDFVMDPSFSFRVGKECAMFESREVEEDTVTDEQLDAMGAEPFEYPLSEEAIKQRYDNAVRLAGYKGDFKSYRKLFEKGK